MAKRLIISKQTTLPDHKKIEAMKAHFEKNPPKMGVQAPISIKKGKMKVANLMGILLPQYQRGYEQKRTEDLVQSIILFGIMKSVVITVVVDKNGEIIGIHDGRHRLVALHILGFVNVEVVMVEFKCDQDEIDHFNMINKSQRPLTPEQRMMNGFQAGNQLSTLIYKLGYFDSNSKWSDKVSLMGTGVAKKGSISVANFTKIMNWVALELRRRMEGESDLRATRKLEKMKYEDMLDRMNEFHDYFYKLAHFPHPKGDIFMKDKVLISILEFFYCANNQPSTKLVLSPERILKTSISKFRGFNFNELQGYDAAKAPNYLFQEFNGIGARKRANPVVRINID